jgi:hypothetical protein
MDEQAGRRDLDKIALAVIDARQEYFALLGKVEPPDGPAAVKRIASALA